MRTFACLVCVAAGGTIGLPKAERTVEELQADLRRNLTCTVATYAALDHDATEADFDRAEEICG